MLTGHRHGACGGSLFGLRSDHGPAEVTDRDAVVRAMREYDELGRDAFLARYGFKRSTKFVVVDNGHEFDSKALLAAAHGFQYPEKGAASQYLQRR